MVLYEKEISDKEKFKQRRVFAKLFGFKVGDRVKRLRRTNWSPHHNYWQYGTVHKVEKRLGRVFGYIINWDGKAYSSFQREEDFFLVRKYNFK